MYRNNLKGDSEFLLPKNIEACFCTDLSHCSSYAMCEIIIGNTNNIHFVVQ